MSSQARLEKEGLLGELKRKAIALSVEIHALSQQINRVTDRQRVPLDEVNLEEAALQMQAYQDKLREHRDLCVRIKELAEDLNVPMPATDVRRRRG